MAVGEGRRNEDTSKEDRRSGEWKTRVIVFVLLSSYARSQCSKRIVSMQSISQPVRGTFGLHDAA